MTLDESRVSRLCRRILLSQICIFGIWRDLVVISSCDRRCAILQSKYMRPWFSGRTRPCQGRNGSSILPTRTPTLPSCPWHRFCRLTTKQWQCWCAGLPATKSRFEVCLKEQKRQRALYWFNKQSQEAAGRT